MYRLGISPSLAGAGGLGAVSLRRAWPWYFHSPLHLDR